MTLLELLVKELDEWPEGYEYIAQDPTDDYGFSSVWLYKEKPLFDEELWLWWLDAGFDLFLDALHESDDYRTAIITRPQWESAKLAATK